MEDEIRACSGIANEGLDPTMFALATILPMSCFPIDSVHPSARYGATEDDSYGLQDYADYGTTSGDDMRSLPSYDSDHCLGRYGMNDADLLDQMPPLSASTVSSDSSSNWFSSDPAPEFGFGETFDTTALSPSDGVSVILGRYSSAADLTVNSLGIAAREQLEYGWNAWALFNLGSAVSHQPSQPIESQSQSNALLLGFSTNSSTTFPFDMAAAFQASSSLAMAASPASELLRRQPAIPSSTELLTPENSPNHIDKEVDDFLDELANVIDWDSAELNIQYPETNTMDFVDPQCTNMMNPAPSPGYDQGQGQELGLHGTAYSHDSWEDESTCGDVEFSPSFTELLNEQDHRLLRLSSDDLRADGRDSIWSAAN